MKRTSFMVLPAIVAALMLFSSHAVHGQISYQEKMIQDFEFIKNVFNVKYAPREWKQHYASWDLAQASERTKKDLLTLLPRCSLKEYQLLLKKFFHSAKDYHVAICFYSTEEASLPFTIKGAEGRYFVVNVDHGQMPYGTIEKGDEIVSFGTLPIEAALKTFWEKEFSGKMTETDAALLQLNLTKRVGSQGNMVPQGQIEIGVKKKTTGQIAKYLLKWNYCPEKVKDVALLPKASLLCTANALPTESMNEGNFFDKMMMCAYWKEPMGIHADNRHLVGVKKSFIPDLGKRVWQHDTNSSFDAYVFLDQNKKKIGFVRIPHYVGDEDEALEFGRIVSYFQENCEAVIIDQMNNPGGSLFYLYALMSMLTDKNLHVPEHHMILTQGEIHLAASMLNVLNYVKDDATAVEVIGKTLGGYPIDYIFACRLKEFCQFLIKEWESGHLYTSPTHLFGFKEVRPHPKYRCTKPLLVLTNELDFSGGDFFPAIIQDNKRGILLGSKTAGAGGFVLQANFPNHTGIKSFSITASHAVRNDKKPIENLGIIPDVTVHATAADLQGNYEEFSKQILLALDRIIQKG